MAIVGSAYVEINAVTDGVADSIRDALRRGASSAGPEGRRAGEEYASGFNDAVSNRIGRANLPDVGGGSGARRRSGSDAGEEWGSYFARGLETSISAIKPIKLPIGALAMADVAASKIGPLIGLVGQLGAGAFAMGSQVAHGSAALIALAGAAGQAAGAAVAIPVVYSAIGQAMAVVKLASSGVGDAIKALADGSDDAAEKLAKLPPAAQAFAREVAALKPRLDELRQTAAAGLFPGVSEGLRGLLPLFPMVKGVVGDTAEVIGTLASRIGHLVGGPLSGELTTVLQGNVNILRSLSDAGVQLVNMFLRIMAAASPMVQVMGVDFSNAVERASNAVVRLAESGDLALYFTRAYNTLKLLISILGNVGSALFSTFSAGVETGNQMLAALDQLTQTWRTWAASFEGQNTLREYFASAWSTLQLLGSVLANVIVTFANMAEAARPAGTALMTSLDGVTQRWREFTGSVEGQNRLREFFDSTVPVVQEFGRLLAAVGMSVVHFASLPGNDALLRQIRTELLPAVERLFTAFQQTGLLSEFIGLLTNMANTMSNFAGSTGAATGIIDVLNAALSGLNAALQIPGVATLLLIVTYAAGANYALTLLLGVARGLGVGMAALSVIVNGLGLIFTRSGLAAIAFNAQLAGFLITQQLIAAKTALVTAAQWAWNAAMSANPIGLVVIALAALVMGLTYAYQNSETFRNFVTAAFEAVLNVGRAIGDFFTTTFPNAITTGVNAVIGFFQNTLPNAAASVGAWISSLPGIVGNGLASLGSTIATVASAAWSYLVSSAQTAGTNVVNFLANLPQNIAYALGHLAGTLVRLGIEAGVGLYNAIVTGVTNLIVFFAELPGRIAVGLVNLVTNLRDTGTSAGTSFLQAVTTAFVAVVSFFQELPGRIVAGLATLVLNLTTTAQNTGQAFLQGVVTSFIAVVSWFQALPGQILGFLSGLAMTFMSQGSTAIDGFLSGLLSAWVGVTAWFVTLPARVVATFATAGTWLLSAGMDILNGLIAGLVQGTLAVVSFFTGLVDSFVQGFKDALGIASPSTVFAQFGTWILEGLINGLNAMIAGVVAVVTLVGDSIVAGFNAFIGFIGTLWTTFWNGLNAITFGLFDPIRVIIETILTAIQLVFQAVTALISGDWDAFWAYLNAAANVALSLISAIWSAAWTGIQTIAATIWNAIQVAFQAWLAAAQLLWTTIWTAVSTFFSTIWIAVQTAAVTIWTAIQTFFSSWLTALQTLWTTVWNAISTFFTAVWTAIQTLATNVWNAIQAFLTGGLNSFQVFWQAIWSAIQAFFNSIWVAIQNAATTIWNAIVAFLQAGLNAFNAFWSTTWNAISTAFSTIWNAIRTAASTIWGQIQSFFTNALNTFKTGWDNFWNSIATGFSRIWEGIRATADSAWQGINNLFRSGINLVIDAVNWPINQINSGLGISIPTIDRLATGGRVGEEGQGGRVKGVGSTTNDAVLTRLSREEHVWSAAEVRAAGGHDAVRRMRAQVMAGMNTDTAPGTLANQMATHRVDPDSLGGTSVAQGLRRRQLMDKFPNMDDLGRGMLAYGGVAPHVAAAGDEIVRTFGPMPGGIGGVGARANASDHPKGLALDFMTMGNVGLGDRVAQHLMAHGQRMAVKYLIWQQAINQGGGWERMEDRGSATANHMDHVHASFTGSGVGNAFSGGGLFDPGAFFDSIAAGLGLPESGRAMARNIMPDSPEWMDPMGVGFFDKAWTGFRATAIKLLTAVSTVGGLLGGGGTAEASGPVADQVRGIAAQYGWDQGAEWNALNELVNRESSWNPAAANPTSSARGLFQKMTSLHGPVEPTAAGQAQWGLGYIQQRYGSPSAALAHHDRVGSYDRGGWLKPGITQAINGTGKPEAIIADPMTTFERSFKNVFKWFAPECREAIEDSWRGATGWIKDMIDRFWGRDKPQPVPVPQLPPAPVIPPVEIPPIIVPEIPTGALGVSFEQALSRFAPELGFAIEAGASSQIAEFAGAIQGNDARMAAISEAMGIPVAELQATLSKLVESVAPAPAPVNPTPRPVSPFEAALDSARAKLAQFGQDIDPNGRYDSDDMIRKLAKIAGMSESEYRRANPTMNDDIRPYREIEKNIDRALDYLPSRLESSFYRAFPDIDKALDSSSNDLQTVLANRANDILKYLSTLNASDANAILRALGADPAATTATQVMADAQRTVSTTAAPAGPTVTIADGAVQLNINGNADSATIEEINTVLQESFTQFSEEILRQYEGRT